MARQGGAGVEKEEEEEGKGTYDVLDALEEGIALNRTKRGQQTEARDEQWRMWQSNSGAGGCRGGSRARLAGPTRRVIR